MLLMLIKLSSPLKCLFHWCASPWLPGVVDSRSECAGSSRIFLLFLFNLQPFCFIRCPQFAFKSWGRLMWSSKLVLMANLALLWTLFFLVYWYFHVQNVLISNIRLCISVGARIYLKVCAPIQTHKLVYLLCHLSVFWVSWVPVVWCRDPTPLSVSLRDVLGGRVITGKKNVALSRVSADFRHNGARVSRQAFLAN